MSTPKIIRELYWNGTGKYEEEYKMLRKKLVPRCGKADTPHGELLRVVGNIYYDYNNNGNYTWHSIVVNGRYDLGYKPPKDVPEKIYWFFESAEESYYNYERHHRFENYDEYSSDEYDFDKNHLEGIIDAVIEYVYQIEKGTAIRAGEVP